MRKYIIKFEHNGTIIYCVEYAKTFNEAWAQATSKVH
jgi:hypothetical protein